MANVKKVSTSTAQTRKAFLESIPVLLIICGYSFAMTYFKGAYIKYRDCKSENIHFRPSWCGSRIVPIEPWAFIRVKNEIITVKACLESIIPVIKKGIIVHCESTDGTLKYLQEFVKKNPGYQLYNYPYKLIDQANMVAFNAKVDDNATLAGFYNFVASKIPMNEWLIKIDVDHVYDTEKLFDMMRLPKTDDDVICLTRYNILYDPRTKNLQILEEMPYNTFCDHWMVRKTKDFVFYNFVDHLNGFTYYHEDIKLQWFNDSSPLNYYTEASSWHFPCMKIQRHVCKGVDYKYIGRFDMNKNLAPNEITDEKKVREIITKLNLSEYNIRTIFT